MLKQLLLTFNSQHLEVSAPAEKSQGKTDPAAACQLCCDLSAVVVSAPLNYASSAAILSLSFNLSTQTQSVSSVVCTISSSVICQLWLQFVSSARMQTLSWATTLSINHNLSAQPQTVSSTALCQLESSLSANLYTISSSVVCQLQVEYVSLFQTQTVCLAAVCQLSCNLSTQLSAQLQLVNSAVSSGASCQLTLLVV